MESGDFKKMLEELHKDLTFEDFHDLLKQVVITYKSSGQDDPYRDIALNVSKWCWKNKKVSLKQFVCLYTFVTKNNKKTFKEFK